MTGMPKLLAWLSVIGTAAMLWVGGHILLVGFDELGWEWPYHLVHELEHPVDDVTGVGGVLGWLVNTLASAVVGFAVGAVIALIVDRLPKWRPSNPTGAVGVTGAEPVELPSGTVTFLFTDLEGSTRLWEANREAMAAAVARHDALLDDSIHRHGGIVFSNMGDGMAAAFGTARRRGRGGGGRAARVGRRTVGGDRAVAGRGWASTPERVASSGISTRATP